MAQLYFYYSTMNAGKSTHLLQSSYNYRERGMNTLLYTADIDNRFSAGQISSRLGLHADANLFSTNTDIALQVTEQHTLTPVSCVLVDEAQFLTEQQVKQLTDIVDNLKIPVLAYGIRTDFLGKTFVGSAALLAWADKLIELKTICHCGKKANFVVRTDDKGNAVTSGAQIEVGGNERYESLCRKHFKALVW
ncbi:thymidine kinase [Thalassotalea sp. 1_MG-2023]|uniref:thymidine kinase n=1 Tax=Thalassotalea sp. 1_MG-2023 TaxID=3062680 RepID=UPI0026E393C2|nr:thymidine kinase [Thalassotalea sp. 1_MG-2023]MDO6427743.1 thymidine kinase [Thalassotalea sp. 1_MG-2023]